MNPEDVVQVACIAIAVVSAIALVLLHNPTSFLSRLVDRPADENTHHIGGPR